MNLFIAYPVHIYIYVIELCLQYSTCDSLFTAIPSYTVLAQPFAGLI